MRFWKMFDDESLIGWGSSDESENGDDSGGSLAVDLVELVRIHGEGWRFLGWNLPEWFLKEIFTFWFNKNPEFVIANGEIFFIGVYC